MSEFAVIIVAAGTGSRAGDGLPKQYRDLTGEAVLRHTVNAFLHFPGLVRLCVVINKEHEELYQNAVRGLGLPQAVIGGATRQESVAKGLKALDGIPDDMPVLIHDGARPFVEHETILNCLKKLETAQAITTAIPVHDTLRRSDDGYLGEVIKRENVWLIQTPQGFHYNIIKRAHETTTGEYTDDSQMVSDMGVRVELVSGSRRNIKLTTEDDFKNVKKKITKTGLGYDVHAFGEASNQIRIGGIDIPHTKKLLGHSDADVVLHAITDAIYGTIASGDIGSHFPPSNDDFKNMDSSIFLKKAMNDLTAEEGKILHIDTVIICEDPKIGPHRDKIRESIANICNLPVKSVSVKATTSEGLGFTGRREGIAAQAIVTIEI